MGTLKAMRALPAGLLDLRFAWIEYGSSADAIAFADGLRNLGWQNLFAELPQHVAGGVKYRRSADHPLLPIAWKGSALLALPNDKVEGTWDRVRNPLFDAYVAQHGEDAWKQAVLDYNEFLGRWAVDPGLKKTA